MLAELIWFKSYSIFILQLVSVAYCTVAFIDIVSGSTTSTSHYKWAIILSVLFPPCTLMCSLYYIARVGLSFVLFYFTLLNGLFFEAQIQIYWIGSINVNQWKLKGGVGCPVCSSSISQTIFHNVTGNSYISSPKNHVITCASPGEMYCLSVTLCHFFSNGNL